MPLRVRITVLDSRQDGDYAEHDAHVALIRDLDGHTNVRTTTIYGDAVSDRLWEADNLGWPPRHGAYRPVG
jgi:hypothetical protein